MKLGIASLESEVGPAQVRSDIAAFWAAAFSSKSRGDNELGLGFREFLLEKYVAELNQYSKEWEDLLAGNGAHMDVTLNSKDLSLVGEKDSAYDLRSGGERRRSDLAVLFGLMEMARLSSSFRPDFLFLDEAFDALDKEGRQSVKGVLEHWARKVAKVFVITHSDVTLGLQKAGEIRVSKGPKGSVYDFIRV